MVLGGEMAARVTPWIGLMLGLFRSSAPTKPQCIAGLRSASFMSRFNNERPLHPPHPDQRHHRRIGVLADWRMEPAAMTTYKIASGRALFTLHDGRFFGALTERVIPNDIIPSEPTRNAVTKTLEECLAAFPAINHGPIDKQVYNNALRDLAAAIRAIPAPEPQPEVADLIERLNKCADAADGSSQGAKDMLRLAAHVLASQGAIEQPEVAAEPVGADWDIEKTADAIAKSLATIKHGRIHGDIYNAAKAGAIEALKCAAAAITTLPAVATEPVAWQSRARQRMEDHVGEWSEWRDGKAPQPIPPYWEVEERPLATPPVVEEAVKADQVAQLQLALVAWVNVAEMLADQPVMEAHFQDVADATLDVVETARDAVGARSATP